MSRNLGETVLTLSLLHPSVLTSLLLQLFRSYQVSLVDGPDVGIRFCMDYWSVYITGLYKRRCKGLIQTEGNNKENFRVVSL